ncbi:conjugal transfer protein [Streptomyces niveus]|uniref:conjugal transfer protein n=1 Tax=Streptomyces niveus TaxID=193462 RepID=UPI00368CCA17
MSVDRQVPDGDPPVIAAGVVLDRMRRRVRLGRWVVWGALAAGPVALAVAVASPPSVVEAAVAKPVPSVRTEVAADPSGYAAQFVAAWLRGRSDGPASAPVAQAMAPSVAPSVELPEPATDMPAVAQVTAVRAAQRGDGRWSVTVAAQYAATVRYFAVPVAAGRDGETFAVVEAPAEVAAPRRAGTGSSPFSVTVPAGGALASTVGEFLAAYLAGQGEVGRYLAPGVRLAPVAGGSYTDVEVGEIRAVEKDGAAETVPADGTTVRVLARVEATDRAAKWPMAYEMTLSARSKRWELRSLDSGAGAR